MKVVAAAVDCCDDDNGTKGKVHLEWRERASSCTNCWVRVGRFPVFLVVFCCSTFASWKPQN